MLKKTITSTDLFTNTTTTADYYFNLTKAEAVEINLIEDLEDVSKSTDPKAIIPVFKNIIHYSYGIKTREGRFTKDKDLTTGFLASDAYSELFLELLQDGEQGVVNFINGILGFNVDELRNTEAVTGTARTAPQPEGSPAPAFSIPNVPVPAQRDAVNWTGDSYPKEARPELGDTWNGRSLQPQDRPAHGVQLSERTVSLQDPQPSGNNTPPQPGEQLGGTPFGGESSVYDQVLRQSQQPQADQQ